MARVESETGSEFLNLHELVKRARIRLNANHWDYLTGGAESETTLKRNRLAIDSLAFRPRVLRNVVKVDPSGKIFGKPMRLPVMLAPVGSIQVFDPGGTVTVAKAAGRFGVPMVLSSVAEPGLEPTGAVPGRKIFQLYVRFEEKLADDIVRRAEAAGYEAFCLTVDTAHYSRRERDIGKRNLNRVRNVGGREFQAALDWAFIKRFKDKHRIPLILKGIATAEDAATACESGVDGVWVSNHGGRQLDQGAGTLDILPEVVAAVKGRAQIIIDGGFCRGTDVLKAVTLGADAVAVGRLYCYGLAANGEEGVVRILELLEHEMITAMALIGVTRLQELDKSYLRPAPPVVPPHVLSAFPLLNLADEGYSGG